MSLQVVKGAEGLDLVDTELVSYVEPMDPPTGYVLDVLPLRARVNGFNLQIKVSPVSHDNTVSAESNLSSDKYNIFKVDIKGAESRLLVLISAFRSEGLKVEEQYGDRYYGWRRYLHRGISGVESGFL